MRRTIIPALAIMLLAACTMAPLAKPPVDLAAVPDGTHPGSARSWPNRAEVQVTVQNGRMTDIELVNHRASWIGKQAVPAVPLRIIEKQSANVDAVTGATNSSRVIMHAVHDALEQAVRTRAAGKGTDAADR